MTRLAWVWRGVRKLFEAYACENAGPIWIPMVDNHRSITHLSVKLSDFILVCWTIGNSKSFRHSLAVYWLVFCLEKWLIHKTLSNVLFYLSSSSDCVYFCIIIFRFCLIFLRVRVVRIKSKSKWRIAHLQRGLPKGTCNLI